VSIEQQVASPRSVLGSLPGTESVLRPPPPKEPPYKLWDAAAALVFAAFLTGNLYQGFFEPLRLLTTAGSAVCLLITAAELIRRRHRIKVIVLPFALLASFIPGALAAATNSYAPLKSLELFTIIPVALIAPAVCLSTPRRLRYFLVCLSVIGIVLGVLLVVTPDPSSLHLGRRTISGVNPIALGRLVGLAGLLALYAWLFNRRKGRHLVGACILAVVLILGALTTGTRAVLVAVCAATATAIYLRRAAGRAHRGRDLLGVIAFAVAVGFMATVLNSSAVDRASTGDTAARLQLASASWNVIRDHPAGIGWGNLLAYLPNGTAIENQLNDQYSHNVFLEVTAEGGWIAGAGFVLLMCLAFRRSRAQCQKTEVAMLGGALMYALVSALFSSNILGNRLLWGLLGLALACSHLEVALRSDARGAVADRHGP